MFVSSGVLAGIPYHFLPFPPWHSYTPHQLRFDGYQLVLRKRHGSRFLPPLCSSLLKTRCRYQQKRPHLSMWKKYKTLVYMFDVAVRMPLRMPTSHVKMLGFESWIHFPFHLYAHVHSRRQQVTPSGWVHAIHIRDLDWVLGSWIQSGPAPSIAGIWGVN